MKSIAILGDCMKAMAQMKDNEFSLAIIDPPYGIGMDGQIGGCRKTTYKKQSKKDWDRNIPSKEYFIELFRVSRNQIIWGANYMIEYLSPKMGWIFWDKKIGGNFSAGELAWTSFDVALKMIQISIETNRVSNNKEKAKQYQRIHPTQKPIALYKWLLKNYAKEGDTILDTHLGSASSRIAAHQMGFDFTGYEIDKDYFDAQEKRFKTHIMQGSMFNPDEMY